MGAVSLGLVRSRARERIRHQHLRERESGGRLVVVDTDADVLVDPDRCGIAPRRAGAGCHAFAAPPNLFAAAPVERGPVEPLARQTQHLWPERAQVHAKPRQACAEHADRVAHRADRSLARPPDPDAQRERLFAPLECFLRYRGELVNRPPRKWGHRDASRKSTRVVPQIADIKGFSRISDWCPEARVSKGGGLASERALIVVAQRDAAIDAESDLHLAER